MGLSKYMTPPQFKHTTAPRPAIDFAPHLVPKDKTRKITSKTATKPTDRTILLAKSDSPAIPDVVLEHAAPCETGMKVEDRLFDRCGSVFVLRKSKSSSQCRTSSRSATGRLEPPSHLKAAEVHGEPSNAQLGASKNTVREVGDQDMEMDLDATSQSDYCTYMAGLYSDD
ncbi:hypothetical protein P3342_002084 [Pyrenophora teres f. teres]|nr:hypothetical protein HRS9122_04093 [Pyrenophora teres f. teres]KAE8866239.1 hypothetical protein PTNB29_03386 [Pyrenophora teres f. teres]KAE8871875.1 hypothetical protein PTNB73_03334 [Pyrenophora teres f. teres]KAK1919791.1 hypothetical protein P3342_002084 [Pyrenophora teres f. teres]